MYYLNFFKRLLSSLIIGGQAINFIFKGKISKNDLFDQLMESGPGSLLIVLITGIAAGTVFNIQVASQLTSMGVSSEIGGLLAVGMAREMAPLLTATLMTGKVATAYAAQLGTMKVTEQIEAITMLRTEPVQYLVVPRLLSMVIMSPIQCLLFFICSFMERPNLEHNFLQSSSNSFLDICKIRKCEFNQYRLKFNANKICSVRITYFNHCLWIWTNN